MIRTSVEVSMGALRQRMLVGAVVAGGVVLAACGGGSTRHATRSAVSSTTTTTGGPISYPVRQGDTLTAIARFFGLSTAELAAFNQLANGDQLTVGQVLQIPRHPPVALVVKPAHASAGDVFELDLTGAKAGEAVTFEIDAPDGSKFTGPAHTASPEGSVTTTYETGEGDHPGTYNVVATGDHGTSVRATFRVESGSPTG